MGKLVLSPSQVKDWRTCKLRWAFRIEGAPSDTNRYLARGSKIHREIEAGQSPELEDYYRVVQPRPEVIEREQLLEVDLYRDPQLWVVLRGRIDALAYLDGQLVVVDYKTGQRRPKRLRYQLIYPLMVYRARGEKPTQLVVEYLDDLSRYSVDPWPALTELVQEYVGAAREIKQQMKVGLFPPNPGYHCGFCGYRQQCLEIFPPDSPNDGRIKLGGNENDSSTAGL